MAWFHPNSEIDFVALAPKVVVASVMLMLVSLVLLCTRGLNFGVDFTGGVLIEAHLTADASLEKVRKILAAEKITDVSLQNFNRDDLMIRLPQIKGDTTGDQTKALVEQVKQILHTGLEQNIEFQKIDFVGPQVGRDLIIRSIIALICAVVVITLYLWLRFEWQFGVAAVASLVHDSLLMLGFFSLFRLTFDLTAITAVLTIVGYSVNDSVVLYDRVREYQHRFKGLNIVKLLNQSTNSVLRRSLLTSGSTLLALLALVLFGGNVLASFSRSCFFGVFIGTYSSIFISLPILQKLLQPMAENNGVQPH